MILNKEITNQIWLDIDNKIAYVWSPKAACTFASIAWCKYLNIPLKDVTNESERFHDQKYVTRYRNSMKRKFLEQKYDMSFLDNYFKFQVSRNPYTKAVSSYLHCLKFDYGDIASEKLSFYTFLIKLKNYKKEKLAMFDGHVAPQYKLDVDLVIKIEDIDIGIKKLNELTNMNFKVYKDLGQGHSSLNELKKAKDSKFYGRTFDQTFVNILRRINFNLYLQEGNKFTEEERERYKIIFESNIDYKSMPSVNNYADFYDDEIKNLVTELYQKDIEYFNYDFPYK